MKRATVVTARMKSYIQPFERVLALEELAALSSATPEPAIEAGDTNALFRVRTTATPENLAENLTYWEAVAVGDRITPTLQTLREATFAVAKNGSSFSTIAASTPFTGFVPVVNRRALRYATHGLHEYRGKFFPQLVRALINIAGVPKGALVADPMVGSGTTAVESLLANRRALGLDVNPLSARISTVKCALLFVDPVRFRAAAERLAARISTLQECESNGKHLDQLSPSDIAYLRAWFAPDILELLDRIASVVAREKNEGARELAWVALSNILRRVSYQDEDDLRVRRRQASESTADPVREFLSDFSRSARMVYAFLRQNRTPARRAWGIAEGDARNCRLLWRRYLARIDLFVTSPPYATALPYLDTDRLSLSFLGLLSRSEHRRRDLEMIGNREISERIRREYWERFLAEQCRLPASVSQLVLTVEKLNGAAEVGFRRRNVAALLSKYFFDMTSVLRCMIDLARPGASAFLVVGDNHTVAGGERIDIPTATLLSECAASVGWNVETSIPMEMLLSRDIFSRNATASEQVVCLKRPN